MTEVVFRLVEHRTGRKLAVTRQVDLPSNPTWRDYLDVAREHSAAAVSDGASMLAGMDAARSDAEYERLVALAREDLAVSYPAGAAGNLYRIGAEHDAADLPAAVAYLGGTLAAAQFSHAWWNSEVGGEKVSDDSGVSLADLEARFEAIDAMDYPADPLEELQTEFVALLEAAEEGQLSEAVERARQVAERLGLRRQTPSLST